MMILILCDPLIYLYKGILVHRLVDENPAFLLKPDSAKKYLDRDAIAPWKCD
jgi:hypothetical protein